MAGKRRRFTAEFKARGVRGALREDKTLAALAGQFGAPAKQIAEGRRQAPAAMPDVLGRKTQADGEGRGRLPAGLRDSGSPAGAGAILRVVRPSAAAREPGPTDAGQRVRTGGPLGGRKASCVDGQKRSNQDRRRAFRCRACRGGSGRRACCCGSGRPSGSLRNSSGNVTHGDGSTLFQAGNCPAHGDKLINLVLLMRQIVVADVLDCHGIRG